MTINKFQGKTKEEAIGKAKAEFGETAVIMNVREIKGKGIFGFFKGSTFEVTAAMQERDSFSGYAKPAIATKTKKGLSDVIDFVADEEIKIPPYKSTIDSGTTNSSDYATHKPTAQDKTYSQITNVTPVAPNTSVAQPSITSVEKVAENRLDRLADFAEDKPATKTASGEELKFARVLYNTLISNEVNEKYVNQILGEMEKVLRPGNNVDAILSNVYQKLILQFGQPKGISLSGAKPKVVFFIGPTGVGKTTTIAKIASKYKVEMERKVAFITADTYRIAATEQLKVYANILDVPMSIVYSADELTAAVEQYCEYDMIFVDTAGFSHKNDTQKNDTKALLDNLNPIYEKDVYLVVSATTKYNDLLEIIDMYKNISDYKLIFTKLDETSTYGNLLNVKLYSGAELSYATTGQNVPDDIEIFDVQKIVKQLLGGK